MWWVSGNTGMGENLGEYLLKNAWLILGKKTKSCGWVNDTGGVEPIPPNSHSSALPIELRIMCRGPWKGSVRWHLKKRELSHQTQPFFFNTIDEMKTRRGLYSVQYLLSSTPNRALKIPRSWYYLLLILPSEFHIFLGPNYNHTPSWKPFLSTSTWSGLPLPSCLPQLLF